MNRTLDQFSLVTLSLSALLLAGLSHADQVAVPAGDNMNLVEYLEKPTPTTTPQLQCLIQLLIDKKLIAPKTNQGSNLAATSAKAINDSLRDVGMDPRKFTQISLYHLLAQAVGESGVGATNTQQDKVPPDKMGYGLCQVTGESNRNQCAACMNRASPGAGNDVVSNPENTIGDHGTPFKSALVCLCWWKINMAENKENDAIITSSDLGCNNVQKVVEIQGQGHLSTPPNWQEDDKRFNLKKRCAAFQTLVNEGKTCLNGNG